MCLEIWIVSAYKSALGCWNVDSFEIFKSASMMMAGIGGVDIGEQSLLQFHNIKTDAQNDDVLTGLFEPICHRMIRTEAEADIVLETVAAVELLREIVTSGARD